MVGFSVNNVCFGLRADRLPWSLFRLTHRVNYGPNILLL